MLNTASIQILPATVAALRSGLGCGTPADRDNFTALLAEFRRQLDAVRPGLLLTVAVGAILLVVGIWLLTKATGVL